MPTHQTQQSVGRLYNDQPMLAELLARGYVVRPFLSGQDVAALRTLQAESMPENAGAFYVTAAGPDLDVKHRIFHGITSLVAPQIEKVAPGYRIVNAVFVSKQAGATTRLKLHQDYSLVDHSRVLGINVWIPLCDVDDSNGCMRMVDFSQHFGHICATSQNPAPYDSVRGEMEARYLTDVHMKAGEALLFDMRVLHATEGNRTSENRAAVYLNLCPVDESPRVFSYNPDQPGRFDIFEVDTEFLLALRPNQSLTPEQKSDAKFAGTLECNNARWTVADLKQRFADAGRRAPESTLDQARNYAARRAVSYLLATQLPDGEYQTEFCYNRREAEDGSIIEDLVFDSSPFVTSLVLYSMQFAKDLDSGISEATRRGLDFLVSEMDPGGLWRYWTRKNSKRSIIPPDLDDTSCISHLLRAHGRSVPDNDWLFYDSRDKRGAFYTWLYKANSSRKWLLWLRTGGKAFSYTKELWQWTSGDDVCAVVNANVLTYLGENTRTQRAIEYLLRIFQDGAEDKQIVFYAHRLSLYYFASRAFACGVTALAPAAPVITERTLALQQPDGSFGDELQTGLAICTLLNLGANPKALGPAVQYLLSTQSEAGSWRRIPMYGGPPTPTTFGSADLTTAICLEALARCGANNSNLQATS